jgi:formylglycine-generating enzyme required for sulfatase activity/serine/threonine protein kinase
MNPGDSVMDSSGNSSAGANTVIEPGSGNGQSSGVPAAAVTRIEGTVEASPDAAGVTRIETGAPASRSAEHFSPYQGATFLEYRLDAPIGKPSGEALVWTADRLSDGKRVVLKFYHEGREPKPEVIEFLKSLPREHVVGLIDCGHCNGRFYEVLEYISGGTLSDWVKLGVAEERCREVLRELADSLGALHEKRIFHRDIKPSNILVRSDNPLDLALTDFGIASLAHLSVHATSTNRTVAYSPPESITGVVTSKSDWWSVGIIVLEILTGKHPFAGMDDIQIAFNLSQRPVPIPQTLPATWQTLLKGLLTRDYNVRWGADEVRRWLAEEKNISVYYETDSSVEKTKPSPSVRPYKFGKQEYATPESLAEALSQNWTEAVKRFARGSILDWVKELKNDDLTNDLQDISEESGLDGGEKLAVALVIMHPDLPLTWRGEVADRDWIVQNPGPAMKILEGKIPQFLSKLRPDSDVTALSRRWHSLLHQAESSRIAIRRETALILLASDPERVKEEWVSFRAQYADSSNPSLNALLRQTEFIHENAVILLASDVTDLVSHVQKEADRITSLFQSAALPCDSVQAAEIARNKEQIGKNGRIRHGKYSGSSNKRIDAILKSGRPPTEDEKILLGGCDESILLTKKQDWIGQAVFWLKTTYPQAAFDEERARALMQAKDRDEITRCLRPWSGFHLPWSELDRFLQKKEIPFVEAALLASLDLVSHFRPLPGTGQEPYADTGLPCEIIHARTGIELIFVPPGEFVMGSPQSDRSRNEDETPHKVAISCGFYMGRFPVTQKQWKSVIGNNPAKFANVGENAPVERVSWEQAVLFASRAGGGMSLPTEAQWEYACRAGTAENGDIDQMAWHTGNSEGSPQPVGRKKPNAWRFHDMRGNVAEWCLDWYDDYPKGPQRDPRGPEKGTLRVIRGGAWDDTPAECRPASRRCNIPAAIDDSVGFRLCLNLQRGSGKFSTIREQWTLQ